MMQYVSGALIIICLVASFFFGIKAQVTPSSLEVYNQAGLSEGSVRAWGCFLMLGSILLLFPKTFVIANGMMIANSIFTIICFLLIKDVRGAGIEVLNSMIPIILLYFGYPKDLVTWIIK